MDAVTHLLSDLVAIPSVNPMGREVSGPEYLETAMSVYLERWLRELGVDVQRQAVAPGRDNLIARTDGSGSRTTILWDVHQDTVPAAGMTIPPFRPDVVGNRLYGRGSCDVKGGMAAMLVAFARLVRERPPGAASVVLACTVDEEFTHLGSSKLAENTFGASLAIVAEPTQLNLINTHKGAIRWKVRTRGVACHSSTPRLGANAIYRMAAVVEALEEYAGRLEQAEPDLVLGPPSLSVGRIEGGVSVNVVPDQCEIEIDRRVIPGETPADALTAVRSYLRERLDAPDWLEFLPPWVEVPALSAKVHASCDWVGRIATAVRSATGRTPEVGGVPYGTDAGPLNSAGLPCLVFGPGDIAQAHTKDEWIDLDQVRMAADAYFELARELGR